MNRVLMVFVSMLVIATSAAPVCAKDAQSVTVPMKAVSDSGEDGTATLTQVSDGVRVVISLKNAPSQAQPAHIHVGPCSNSTALQYPLTTMDNGSSMTVVKGASLDKLLATPHSVNVHKSTTDLADYVSCGD